MSVIRNLLLAHAHAYHCIHEHVSKNRAQVSLAHNMIVYEPKRWWNIIDVVLATVLSQFYNMAALEVSLLSISSVCVCVCV